MVAEVSPASDGQRSMITILQGLVEVTKLDPTGQLIGPAVKVGALERVAVTASRAVPAPGTITPEAAKRLASEFSVIPKNAPAATQEALNEEVKETSIKETLAALGSSASDIPPGASTGGAYSDTSGSSTVGTLSGTVGGTVGGLTSTVGGTVSGLTSSPTSTPTAPTSSPNVTSPISNLLNTLLRR